MLKNTIVIITGDNGMPFPRAKANVYDLGARVPLIVWGHSMGAMVAPLAVLGLEATEN